MSESKAVILVGGPSRGTRFRPLSLNCPKPLFPVAGRPVISHHLDALSKVKGLKEVLIIGLFEDKVFAPYIDNAAIEFPHLNIRYLHEYQALGTAGGIYHFRDEILRGHTKQFFVMHIDIACSFPLEEMIDAHMKHRGICTMLGTKVPASEATKYGCLVANTETNQVLHYVEKPDTFISDLISCGVFLFDVSVFGEMKRALEKKESQVQSEFVSTSVDELRLEQDILRPLTENNNLYVYVTNQFWRQIKTAGSAILANALYLEAEAREGSERLAKNNNSDGGPEIIGSVYIHPSAHVDPTAKLGPNVSIGPRVNIMAGVRIKDSILLDNVHVGKASCILHSIIGWNSRIGSWTRVEGCPVHEGDSAMMKNGVKNQSITILGKDVSVMDETIIRNCIVLPHKELKSCYHNEILM
ncbi:nucleotide-diphospho-sugar transferase [Cokeromyces recurvatus]|uniref:nucleotide-diphospho-sugar transferase n=1 Tax=Cokeromyces recurvatus TaxID=90255 RepID=UPI00221E9C30|nr:nucleotide-diphospho-sugar transferase [Cokeromyces recurvatus]KAI7904568.1 nucleotide-diphospho-sugar transferase [Cokeromyces recurvatus]